MDLIQKQLLTCLAAYAQGQESARLLPDFLDEDWETLHRMAASHKLVPVVFETLWREQGFCGGNKSLLLRWKRETLMQSVAQTGCSHQIVAVSKILSEAGIDHAVVKGLVCRDLYTRPDLRPSGDEDLFIFHKDREKCGKCLEDLGLARIPGMGDEQVDHYRDPRCGLHIELHNCLLTTCRSGEDQVESLLEEGLHHTVVVETADGPVCTLPPTEHLVFLVLHALKHFLTGGFGIRTLCDVAAFLERYAPEIDLDRCYHLLESTNSRIFMDQLLAVGRDELGFHPERSGWQFCCEPDPEELLMDTLEAGIYGQSTMSRKHSAGMVLEAARENQSRPGLRKSLFPERQVMEKRYPELREHPALLPVCWVKRMGHYAAEVLHSKGKENSPMESVSLGRKRTRMMDKYGILPSHGEKR